MAIKKKSANKKEVTTEEELKTKRFELSVLREIENRPPVLAEGKEVEIEGHIYKVGVVDSQWVDTAKVELDLVKLKEERE